jgi:hypothetical protein
MNDLKKAYRTTMLIALWMIGCVFVYAIIVELVKTSGHSHGATSPAPAQRPTSFDTCYSVLLL